LLMKHVFRNAIDLDGDGTIDMIEFITFLVERRSGFISDRISS